MIDRDIHAFIDTDREEWLAETGCGCVTFYAGDELGDHPQLIDVCAACDNYRHKDRLRAVKRWRHGLNLPPNALEGL